jgi:hypothetical protein
MSRNPAASRIVAVPTGDAAAHLLLAVHVTRIVLGRSREPGVEAWLGDLRVALTSVLSSTDVDSVLARCQQLERDIELAA